MTSRREFLKSGLLSSSAILVSPAASVFSALKNNDTIYLSSCALRGIDFYEYGDVFEKIEAETALILKREPDNEYDELAISVYFGPNKIGYLARGFNRIPARLMDAGFTIHARVIEHDPDAEYYDETLRIGIYLKGNKV